MRCFASLAQQHLPALITASIPASTFQQQIPTSTIVTFPASIIQQRIPTSIIATTALVQPMQNSRERQNVRTQGVCVEGGQGSKQPVAKHQAW